MTDFPPSPIPAGPYDTTTCIAYAVNEVTKVVYQAFSAFTLATAGVMGYVTYDINAATGVWRNLLGELPNFDPEIDRIHAFWLIPPVDFGILVDDHLCILHSEQATGVFASVFVAATGALVESTELTNEGDGTSFFSQHPQIIPLPPTEGPDAWYIVSFSEDTDKMSAFEINFDSAIFTITEHQYDTSIGLGADVLKEFTFDVGIGDPTLYVVTDVPPNYFVHPVQLTRPWAPPVTEPAIASVTAGETIRDVLLVQHNNTQRLLISSEGATFKTVAWDEGELGWTNVYEAGHLVDDFTESQFLSYAALDERAGLASAPHIRGNATVLMNEDLGYTLFCFGPGEYHDISALDWPIDASSITYDFYVQHTVDAGGVPQLAYFVNQGLDEFCRPIATVRYV